MIIIKLERKLLWPCYILARLFPVGTEESHENLSEYLAFGRDSKPLHCIVQLFIGFM
jgi:hypothetical protein